MDAVNVKLREGHDFDCVTLDDEEEERPDHKGHLSHLQLLRWGDQSGFNLNEQEGDEPTEDFKVADDQESRHYIVLHETDQEDC